MTDRAEPRWLSPKSHSVKQKTLLIWAVLVQRHGPKLAKNRFLKSGLFLIPHGDLSKAMGKSANRVFASILASVT
jgi:hypothetical protein